MTDRGPERIAGLAVYRRGSPDGPRVVFVHGSMDRAAAFVKVSRRLSDLTLVSYDRRGYARSLAAGTARDLDEQVRDLMAVAGPEPMVLIGHSLGGGIALAAAERHPELVRAVGAFEAPMPWAPWWPSRSMGSPVSAVGEQSSDDTAEVFMRRIVGDERWEALPEGTRTQRRAEGPALVADLTTMRARPAFETTGFPVPVVAGYGTRSAERHQRSAHELADAIDGAELVVIEGAPHGAHTSHPDEFSAFVRQAVELGACRT